MKKLALLFIGLLGCVHQSNTIEITVRRGTAYVDYKVAVSSSQSLTSKVGTSLALQLQADAVKKASEICEQSQKIGFPLSGSIKQENGEISGRGIVACIDKEQDQEK